MFVHWQPPRAEAVTVLGSLLYFPHHILEIPALEPELMTTRGVKGHELKDLVLDLLLKAGKREPAGLARYVINQHHTFCSKFLCPLTRTCSKKLLEVNDIN